jgi:hypothetical protein
MKPRAGMSVLIVLALGMVLGVQSDAAQAGPPPTAYAQGKGCVSAGQTDRVHRPARYQAAPLLQSFV